MQEWECCKASIAALAAAGALDGRGARAGARQRQGYRHQHGGARLAADPLHAGRVRQDLQGEVRQQREAGDRLHSLGQLLSARRRLALLGREEIPDDRHRQPVDGRLRRGRPLPQAQQIYRRRSRTAGDHRRHAPGAAVDFVVLSLQVEQLLRLPAIPGQSGDRVPQGPVLQRRPSGRISRSSSTRRCPAITTNGKTSTGSATRTSASSSSARRATSSATASPTTISTASPIRPASPTTSPRCR